MIRRPREIKALGKRAMHPAQLRRLQGGLDTFGDDPNPKIARDANEPFDDSKARISRPHAIDEPLINLDHVHRYGQKVGQRGLSGSEVVESYRYTEKAQGADMFGYGPVAVHKTDRLRDLNAHQ